MSPTGRLITIEGIDGTGKSTLADALVAALRGRGLRAHLLREPGGVELSERIRALVKDPALTVGPRAEALLYAAARAQLVEQGLRPRLERGEWIVLDRFVDSSLAYQGGGRCLGIAEVRALNQFATGGLTPDRTLLLWLEGEAARRRAHIRGEEPDRLEREGTEFYERIAQAYAALERAEAGRIRRLDASQSREDVLDQALGALGDLLPDR